MLGERLKQLRKESGDSQERLAEKLHVAPTTICSWEQGRSVPDCEKLVSICRCYQVSADTLLGLSAWEFTPAIKRFTQDEREELRRFGDYLIFRRDST